MDSLLISKNARNRLLVVHVCKGAARGMSDHYLVEGRVSVAERWRPMRSVVVTMSYNERGASKTC